MLRQFYFIDASGKDQGVNVRNRAKELAELLSDVDKIRQERKKARQTKSKYIGHEGSGGGTGGGNYGASSLGGAGARQSRFGGFGSDTGDFGGSSGGGVYGDGGGYGGQQASSSFQDDGYSSRTESRPNKFDEYDEYDDGGAMAARRTTPARRPQPPVAAAAAKPPPKKKEPEPEIDLLGGDDEPFQAPSNGKAAASSNFAALSASDDFDDFDDFQSATPAPTAPVRSNFSSPTPLTSSASGLNLVQPKPLSTTQQSDMTSLTGFTSPSPSVVSSFGSPAITPATTGTGFGGMSDMKPINSGFQPAQPNYFTSVPVAANNPTPSPMSRSSTGSSMQQPKKSSNDAFGSIWNQASSGIKKSTTPTAKTASLQSMAQEKASAGIWGTGAAAKPPGYSGYSGNTTGNGLDDLLG